MNEIHPREALVTRAISNIRDCIMREIRGLTDGERIRVVATACNETLCGIAKFMIRQERHGDTDKSGGLA